MATVPKPAAVEEHEYHVDAELLSGEFTRPLAHKIDQQAFLSLEGENDAYFFQEAKRFNANGLVSFESGYTRVAGSKSPDHGTASRLRPLDSAIVLSKSNDRDDSFKLYARDIIQHPLRAELVTISACYGAQGRAYSGEGLVGLSWAFLKAGAHNVVAALWEATDASTAQLMRPHGMPCGPNSICNGISAQPSSRDGDCLR